MSDMTAWALRTAVGGGALLLVGWWLARRPRSAAGRQRLAELALAAAILVPGLALLPGWLAVPVTVAVAPGRAAPEVEAVAPEGDEDVLVGVWAVEEAAPGLAVEGPAPAVESRPEAVTVEGGGRWSLADVLLGAWAVISAALLARWLLASYLVHRVLRASRPAPPGVQAMFDELSGGRSWRLLVSDRTAVPFSVGLLRPAVVLPARLVETATLEEVGWALKHELTHLRRQDTRTCWLVALAQVVYFFVPWFWWLRRQVRLAQEMVADAEAAPEGLAADYAQFLLSWAVRPPVGATGVSGSSGSDLYRRIAMLLQDRSAGQGCASRGWLVGAGAGLLALAVLAAGARFQARAADDLPGQADGKKQDAKKAEPKREGEKKGFPGLEGLKGLDEVFKGAGLDEDQLKEMRERMREMEKRIEEMRKRFPRMEGMPGVEWVVPGMPGARVWSTSPQQGRLGAQIARPSQAMIDQLDLPKDQGLVLEAVGPNSAAAKAGLKQYDILLELKGKPVPSTPEGLRKLLEGIKADEAVDAVVLRKGKKETIKGLKLPVAKAQVQPFFPALPNMPKFPPVPPLGGFPNVKGDSIMFQRNNDQFTTVQRSGGVSITVKGKLADGKAQVSEVAVEDVKGQTKKYKSLDDVPAEHKEQVQKLAEMSAAGRVRIGR